MVKTIPILRTLALAISATAIAACTTEGGHEKPVTPTEGVYTDAFYKGDHYQAGTGNLWINFRSEMRYDDAKEDYIGPGYILCLDFNTTLAENPDFGALTPGTYTAGTTDTHEAFTLNTASGDSYLVRYEADGASTTVEVVAGTVTVTLESGLYRLDASLALEDGTIYPYSFIGPLTFLNRTGEGHMSNLTQDTPLEGLTQALVIYNGMAFTETSDLYIVLLAGPDYDLDENMGQSDAMMISVNVTPGASDGIPSGSYTIIDAETADDYPVGSALSGVYNMTYGGYFGSWFFSTQNQQEASMRSGTVTVENKGGSTYTFTVRMQDGYGHKVEGTYDGVCRTEDRS